MTDRWRRGYRRATLYNVPATLRVPTTLNVGGVPKKTYADGDAIFCSFRTFGGTEGKRNDLIIVEDTAVVETWYRPDITAGHAIKVAGKDYEILGTPENIDMRGQVMRFKVRRIAGGA